MIVVFGGTGFIAGALVDRLRAEGRDVRVVTHNPTRAKQPGYRYADMQSPETLPPALEGAEIVVQSTQFPGYPFTKTKRGYTYMRYDGIGSERIVAAAREAGVKRYLYVSGVGAGPDPSKPYFAAIDRAEKAISSSGMEWASVRPAFVYGPRDAGLNRILTFARYSPVVPIVGGGAMHQPVFIDDLVEVLRQRADLGSPQGFYELGGPERMTMAAMLHRFFAYMRMRRAIVSVPKLIAKPGAAVLNRLPGQLLSASGIDFISESFVADNQRALEELKLQLTPFEAGLARYLTPTSEQRVGSGASPSVAAE